MYVCLYNCVSTNKNVSLDPIELDPRMTLAILNPNHFMWLNLRNSQIQFRFLISQLQSEILEIADKHAKESESIFTVILQFHVGVVSYTHALTFLSNRARL